MRDKDTKILQWVVACDMATIPPTVTKVVGKVNNLGRTWFETYELNDVVRTTVTLQGPVLPPESVGRIVRISNPVYTPDGPFLMVDFGTGNGLPNIRGFRVGELIVLPKGYSDSLVPSGSQPPTVRIGSQI